MWKYVKRYLVYAISAALFMVGEVLMDLLQPNIMSQIVDNGVLGINNNGMSDVTFILKKGGLMIVLVLFGGMCGAFNNMFVHLSSQNIGNEIRKDAFRNIMSFSFSQTDKFGTGSLITRVTNDVTQTQNMTAQFVRGLIRTSMLTLGSLFFIFNLNGKFGLILSFALVLMLAVMIFCIRKGNPLFMKLQIQLDEINNILQEDISGIRIIKACTRELYEKSRFGKANTKLTKTQLSVLIIFAFMNPAMNILMNAAVVTVLLVGSYEVKSGGTTPGDIMAAITYTTQLLSGVLMLVMLFQNISRGVVSWQRLKEVIGCESDMKDGNISEIAETRGKIEFRNVSFHYPGTNHKVLKNINLTIHSGETLAIMGSTGCGKSTLAKLILRFYDVTEGKILVDDIDVKEYRLEKLREKTAVVLQKAELFGLSIRENIAWGKPNASEEEIRRAAEIAQADDFIVKKNDGYNTRVAERGMSLSGGQKQRISIARAVLKSAPIQIFDDSTSALDLKTEADFYNALEKSHKKSTKIIIAQRIASVRRADRIVVLENGEIADCGTHEELLSRCAVYQDIYQSQLGGGVCE